MLNFILAGAGHGKSSRLINIAEQLSQSDKKIIFIVPEQFSFESDKKIYKQLGAEKFNKILSLSFTSLAKEIFEQYGGRSGEYAEDIHKFILMNKTIKELTKTGSLMHYEKQSKKLTFANDALAIINEFRQCGISADDLISVCDSNPDYSEKINDLSMIYSTYAGMLSDAGLKDSLTDISEAAAVAAMNDYFRNSVVIFDEFESFTGDQYELIDTMFAQADDIYIALRVEGTENIGKNRLSVFESVENTWKSFCVMADKYNMEKNETILTEPLKYKNDDLAFLNKNVMRNNKKTFEKSENISVVECRDLYEEAEFVCAKIKELVVKYGYKYSEIAVISRQLEEYIYIFDSVLKKYDIPYSMNVQKSAVHTRIMQFMINTVNIISESKPSLEAVLTFIKTSLCQITIEEISLLENYSYEWGLEGKDFFEPFKLGIDDDSSIEKIRQRIFDPVIELRKKCSNADCKIICSSIYGYLYEMKIPLSLSELNEEFMKNGMISQAKEQKRIWDMLMTILETFSDIGGDMSLEEFRQLFNSAAENIKFSVPPQTLDSVQIAKAETARLTSPRAVFILGVNEGFFPPASRQSGLLSQKDRNVFEQSKLKLSRSSSELTADERLIVYKSLTHASEKLYILYPTCDNTGEGRFPAAIINQICGMFGNNIAEKAADKDIIFYCSTPQAAYSSFVRNFGKNVSHIEEIKSVLKDDENFSAKINYLYEASKQKEFKIDNTELMKKLYTEKLTISPTAFEDFQMCHFRFFCKTALKLRTLRKREIQSLEQGNMVHKCFEEILRSCKTKQDFDNLEEKIISEMIDRCIDEYMQINMGGALKLTARIKNMIDNIKGDILKAVLHLQKELKQSKFRPVEFEFDIENRKVPVIRMNNGIEIILKGVVDRIDLYEEEGKKYIRVIDYKTGKKKFSVKSLLYGINMQMILYMFSVTGKGGRYSDCEPAGVLYMPSREIECERNRDDDDNIELYLESHYKMNGVVLKERHVLQAMEEDIGGIFIPAKLTVQDSGSGEIMLNKTVSTCFSSKEFQNLKKHTEGLLKQLAKQLYEGEIEANPLIMGTMKPCEFCDYWSVCGNMPCTKFREASENALDEMMEIISGEEKHEK